MPILSGAAHADQNITRYIFEIQCSKKYSNIPFAGCYYIYFDIPFVTVLCMSHNNRKVVFVASQMDL